MIAPKVLSTESSKTRYSPSQMNRHVRRELEIVLFAMSVGAPISCHVERWRARNRRKNRCTRTKPLRQATASEIFRMVEALTI